MKSTQPYVPMLYFFVFKPLAPRSVQTVSRRANGICAYIRLKVLKYVFPGLVLVSQLVSNLEYS